MVLAVLAVGILIGGAFSGRKYFESWISTKQAAGSATPQPSAGAPVVSKPTVQKPLEAPKIATSSSAEPQTINQKSLSYEEQAKVIELNSLGDMAYRDGGCEKALPSYQQVLEIDANNPHAYSAVRQCYAKARNGDMAVPNASPEPSPNQ
jgi:hypothetical protein